MKWEPTNVTTCLLPNRITTHVQQYLISEHKRLLSGELSIKSKSVFQSYIYFLCESSYIKKHTNKVVKYLVE